MTRTMTLRNVPESVVKRLRVQARRNGRSIQAELLSIVTAAAVDREILREQIVACRQAMQKPLVLREIDQAIDEGRP